MIIIPSFTSGSVFLFTFRADGNKSTHISEGPTGGQMAVLYWSEMSTFPGNVNISCKLSGDKVNSIWLSAYPMVDRQRWTNFMLLNVDQNVQLTNAKVTVKKFGGAGQPWRTPQSKFHLAFYLWFPGPWSRGTFLFSVLSVIAYRFFTLVYCFLHLGFSSSYVFSVYCSLSFTFWFCLHSSYWFFWHNFQRKLNIS